MLHSDLLWLHLTLQEELGLNCNEKNNPQGGERLLQQKDTSHVAVMYNLSIGRTGARV